jgi:hypothetical protein
MPFKTSPIFLLVGVVAACGSSAPSTGDTSDDGGASTGGGSLSDGATSPDGASSSGGGSTEDGATDGETPTTPMVLSNTPLGGETGVPLNGTISATFNEAMAPSTLSAATFTVTTGAAVPVQGTVIYATSKAVFWPTATLASNATFTATITTGATNVAGVPLATSHTWSFTTGSAATAGVPVALGTAGQFVILAKTGISTVSPSVITGDLGISPAAATYITGFSLVADSTNVFSTSSQVTGKVYAADYASPTPVNLTTAIGDMGTAFTAAAGRAPDVTGLGAGSIGGMTIPAGVYSWSTGLLLATDVTLTGSATDVWIFQVAKNLTVSNGAHLVLAGGALPQNVFWQVAGNATLGTTVQFEGTILCQTAIALGTSASLTGRLLAQTAATLDANSVVAP